MIIGLKLIMKLIMKAISKTNVNGDFETLQNWF